MLVRVPLGDIRYNNPFRTRHLKLLRDSGRPRGNRRHGESGLRAGGGGRNETAERMAIGPSAIAGRRRVTVALLVAMMVTAVEQLVVSPAMPTIIARFEGV